MEMEAGGKLYGDSLNDYIQKLIFSRFFDLFVAMANFIDDISTAGKSPR
jgi:hypothetical protein